MKISDIKIVCVFLFLFSYSPLFIHSFSAKFNEELNNLAQRAKLFNISQDDARLFNKIIINKNNPMLVRDNNFPLPYSNDKGNNQDNINSNNKNANFMINKENMNSNSIFDSIDSIEEKGTKINNKNSILEIINSSQNKVPNDSFLKEKSKNEINNLASKSVLHIMNMNNNEYISNYHSNNSGNNKNSKIIKDAKAISKSDKIIKSQKNELKKLLENNYFTNEKTIFRFLDTEKEESQEINNKKLIYNSITLKKEDFQPIGNDNSILVNSNTKVHNTSNAVNRDKNNYKANISPKIKKKNKKQNSLNKNENPNVQSKEFKEVEKKIKQLKNKFLGLEIHNKNLQMELEKLENEQDYHQQKGESHDTNYLESFQKIIAKVEARVLTEARLNYNENKIAPPAALSEFQENKNLIENKINEFQKLYNELNLKFTNITTINLDLKNKLSKDLTAESLKLEKSLDVKGLTLAKSVNANRIILEQNDRQVEGYDNIIKINAQEHALLADKKAFTFERIESDLKAFDLLKASCNERNNFCKFNSEFQAELERKQKDILDNILEFKAQTSYILLKHTDVIG